MTDTNPTDIIIGETVPPVEGVHHNEDKTDPHLELKKLLKEQYPLCDPVMYDCCIQIHEELIKLHGENYTEQDYIAYVKSHSSPLCERDAP